MTTQAVRGANSRMLGGRRLHDALCTVAEGMVATTWLGKTLAQTHSQSLNVRVILTCRVSEVGTVTELLPVNNPKRGRATQSLLGRMKFAFRLDAMFAKRELGGGMLEKPDTDAALTIKHDARSVKLVAFMSYQSNSVGTLGTGVVLRRNKAETDHRVLSDLFH